MPATIDEQIANLREVRVLVAQSLTELDEHLDALARIHRRDAVALAKAGMRGSGKRLQSLDA